jgi:hypothetical protein
MTCGRDGLHYLGVTKSTPTSCLTLLNPKFAAAASMVVVGFVIDVLWRGRWSARLQNCCYLVFTSYASLLAEEFFDQTLVNAKAQSCKWIQFGKKGHAAMLRFFCRALRSMAFITLLEVLSP